MLIKNLYTIQKFETSDKKITAQVFVNKNHEIFKGHFPDNPVMPGVCMMQIIKELTEKATSINLFMQAANNIKFMALINPEINPTLDLSIDFSKDEDEVIKVKNITKFGDTTALKFSGTFKIIA